MTRRLQRKPCKGDLIGFGTFTCYPEVREPERPTHIVTRTPEGNPESDRNADRLCEIAPLGTDGKACGPANPFIWFHWTNGRPEGRNLLARIFVPNGALEPTEARLAAEAKIAPQRPASAARAGGK